MKRYFFGWGLMVLVVAALVGCGKKSVETIDYLPCKQLQDGGWGFVDRQGKVYLADAFSEQPSAVREGVFSVRENGKWSLYSFDTEHPKVVLQDMALVGQPRDGVLPVAYLDGSFAIVDLQGKELAKVTEYEGHEVLGSDLRFDKYGLLSVYTSDGHDDVRKLLIDKSGRLVFSPDAAYDPTMWSQLGENLIFGGTAHADDEASDGLAFDLNNRVLEDWSRIAGMQDGVETFDGYVVTTLDRGVRIYDTAGDGHEARVVCPDNVLDVRAIRGDQYVFLGKDWRYGVMRFDGTTALEADYESVEVLDEGYLVRLDGRYVLLDGRGERVKWLDWDRLVRVEGFGWIGESDERYYVVDEAFRGVGEGMLAIGK